MLFYQDKSDDESINLDEKPLLAETKLKELLLREKNPIYVNECYFKRIAFNFDYNQTAYELDLNNNNINLELEMQSDCNLCGIFVVSFDTRLGNIIEWQIPNELNLENIEFKAMASGFHLMQNDLVYFSKDGIYGIAAFESLRVEFSEERNVRMKSVGLMAKSFKSLKSYVPYLKSQVRLQLENPGNYSQLKDLWMNKKLPSNLNISEIPSNSICINETSFIDKLFSRHSAAISKQLSSINQSDYRIYTKFSLYFGASLMSLWKCVVLNKRILFHSAPPIGDLCYRVYCASQLSNTSYNFASSKQLIKPFFFVNVTDIDTLQQEPFYLACTTEKIFENKDHLYDIFVRDSNFTAVLAENQKNLLKVNGSDKKRYDMLIKRLSQIPIDKTTALDEEDSKNEEHVFVEYFTELNDKIFSNLLEYEHADLNYYPESKSKNDHLRLSSCISKKVRHSINDHPIYLNNDQIKKLGLDPSDDREFLNEIIRFYDFNLTLNA